MRLLCSSILSLQGLCYAQAEVLASLGAQDSGLEEDRQLLLGVLRAGDAANASGHNDPNDLATNIVRSGAMAGLARLKEVGHGKGEHAAYHYLRGRIGACPLIGMHVVEGRMSGGVWRC